MPNYTENYNLKKPKPEEFADIADLNYNADIIDEILGKKADLGADGKVSSSQLPEMDYVPAGQKGAANGVASLDAAGKVPAAQLPEMDYVPAAQKGAAGGVATLDDTGKVPSTQISVASGQPPVVTTEGTGEAYTAQVPGITELYPGLMITMIPHTTSTSTEPKLDVNGLGAKSIRRYVATNTLGSSVGAMANWIRASYPITLMYVGAHWRAVSLTKSSATDLSGTVAVVNGGTGATTAATARTNLEITAANTPISNTLAAQYGVADTPNVEAALTGVRDLMPTAKRTVRFVVGTSTAGWTERDCDYLCDGTDDQEEIQAAIDATMYSTQYRNEILILSGEYYISAPINIHNKSVLLSGLRGATILRRNWNSGTQPEGVINTTSTSVIRNIEIFGSKGVFGASNNCGIYCSYGNNDNKEGPCIENCTIQGCAHAGIFADGNCRVINSEIRECSNGILTIDNKIEIIGNILYGNSQSGVSAQRTFESIIANNTVKACIDGISLSSCKTTLISGNSVNTCSNSGISVTSSTGCSICGNVSTNNPIGINSYSGKNLCITGNFCLDNTNGILFSLTSMSSCIGNTVLCGTGQTSDYDAGKRTIWVRSDNNYNLIAYNNIMGKNYISEGGTGNTFTGNKYN